MPAANAAISIDQVRRRCAQCALRELCLPAGLDRDDLARVDRLVSERRWLAAGEKLYHAGSPFHALYLVQTGSLRTQTYSEGGELQILGFHLPGEIMGFDALADETHQCDAETLEPSSVCKLPYAQLEKLSSVLPGLQRQFMRLVSREVSASQHHMAVMGRGQAISRLALFLYNYGQRQNRLGRSRNQLSLTMSCADLANYLGLVLETVSRLFGRLQDKGLIRVKRREITILDMDGLKQIGESAQGSLD